jgi:vacuolar-type H+-ATPase subunit C/Vma6
VFQLLLNLVTPLSNKNGYTFKDVSVVLHDQAFADDISITSSTPKLAQESIDVLVRFLEWYHFQANAKKSITMAWKKFDPRNVPKLITATLCTARTILS